MYFKFYNYNHSNLFNLLKNHLIEKVVVIKDAIEERCRKKYERKSKKKECVSTMIISPKLGKCFFKEKRGQKLCLHNS